MAKTRRIIGILAATAILTTGLAGTVHAQATEVHQDARQIDFDWGTFTLSQRIIDKVANGEPLIMNINIEGLATPIYGVEKQIGTDQGCLDNISRLAITCVLTGPPLKDVTAQIAQLESLLVSGGTDCLGIQSPTPDEFVDLINQYMDAGVPVFTQNTDVPASNRIAFYALNELDAGRRNGRATADLVKDMGLEIGGIALGSGGPTAPWAMDRAAGFMEGFREVFPEADFRMDQEALLPVGFPDYTQIQAIDQAGPFFQGNADVNLMFHTDQGVEGVGIVIRDSGQTGNAWTSGFNVSKPILDLIDEGVILTTINQGFNVQAELAIEACVNLLADGTYPAEPLQHSAPIIITRDGGEGLQSAAEARSALSGVLASGSIIRSLLESIKAGEEE
jgi:ribose transport system substrate-binding protein